MAATIDKIDDARYDVEAKVQKADKEVSNTSSTPTIPLVAIAEFVDSSDTFCITIN